MSNKKKELLRSLKFLLFSISAGVIDAVSYALCFELIGLEAWLSQIVSVTLSVIWNFTLNRRYTFQSSNNVPIAMLKVAAFYLVFTPLSSWGTNYLVADCAWNEYLVKGMFMVANFVLEFLYDRFFVFRGSIDTNERAKK